MLDLELQRIGMLYRATAQHIHDAARRAYEEPLVPVDEIMAHVMARTLAQQHRPAEEGICD